MYHPTSRFLLVFVWLLIGSIRAFSCPLSSSFSKSCRSTTESAQRLRYAFIHERHLVGFRVSSQQSLFQQLRGGGEQDDEIEEENRATESQITEDVTTDAASDEIIVPVTSKSTASSASSQLSSLFQNKEQIISAVSIPLVSFGKFYSDSLQRAPILTKSATAGVVFALSDILAQRLEQRNTDNKNKVVWSRIVASTIVGFAYFGPAAHYWYEWIFRLLPGTSLLSTIQKAALGQVFFGPAFTCIFFASSLIQSQTFSLSNWATKIRNDLPSAVVAGIGFWPIIDLISYSVIPPQWIPLFINFCSLVWTTYLALKSYAK